MGIFSAFLISLTTLVVNGDDSKPVALAPCQNAGVLVLSDANELFRIDSTRSKARLITSNVRDFAVDPLGGDDVIILDTASTAAVSIFRLVDLKGVQRFEVKWHGTYRLPFIVSDRAFGTVRLPRLDVLDLFDIQIDIVTAAFDSPGQFEVHPLSKYLKVPIRRSASLSNGRAMVHFGRFQIDNVSASFIEEGELCEPRLQDDNSLVGYVLGADGDFLSGRQVHWGQARAVGKLRDDAWLVPVGRCIDGKGHVGYEPLVVHAAARAAKPPAWWDEKKHVSDLILSASMCCDEIAILAYDTDKRALIVHRKSESVHVPVEVSTRVCPYYFVDNPYYPGAILSGCNVAWIEGDDVVVQDLNGGRTERIDLVQP